MGAADELLFHYTSAEALLGIVTKRELWCSSTEFASDRLEGAHLAERLKQIADHPGVCMPWAASKPPKHLEALKLATSSSRGAVTASFSRHRGSLTQFRMYSPAAGGYAIGFPRSYLEQVVAGVNAKHREIGLGPEAGLLDCEYALQKREEWCQEFARQFLDLAAAADNGSMSPQDLCSAVMGQSDLFRQWIVARLRFKSDEFRAEDEVRFYKFGLCHHWRSSRDGNVVVPYEVIELPNVPVEAQIHCGPNRDPQLAQLSLSTLAAAAQAAGTVWQLFMSGSGSGYRV
jgi:hypothetical protein